MKRKLLLSVLLTAATWSLSSLATADWDTGPCPGGGTAPCIEAEVSGTTYHFNGSGDHAGEWHSLPTTGEDFEFSGATSWGCNGLNYNCTLSWGTKIKKCQDTNRDWRIGLQVNGADFSGAFICNVIVYGDFPWYGRDTNMAGHCPFEDTCDNFIPYDQNASTLTFNLGSIQMDVLGFPRITDGHLHGLVFEPGIAANFTLFSEYYDCDEVTQDCHINGVLTLKNATSLSIQ